MNHLAHIANFAEENALGPIQRDEALLLLAMVRVIRPKTIVEFGFSYGKSAFNFLQALDGKGDVYSFDIDPSSAEYAAKHFSSFANFHFLRKSQEHLLPSDTDGKLVDLAFFDGAHDATLNQRTFTTLLPMLTQTAIICVHDTGTWHRKHFLPEHERFASEAAENWLDADHFQHRREERMFVNWIASQYPDFQVMHLHSSNCLRHGLTLIQRQRWLAT